MDFSKLYDSEKQVEKCMEDYQIDRYVEPIIDLLDGFSNWYIRRSRRRFWSTEKSKDKQDAYETTFYVLVSLCKLLAQLHQLSQKNYINILQEMNLCIWLMFQTFQKNLKMRRI